MARLKVNPTRMVLAELKRKLVTAKRGHKLLKDKQDELMRQFISRIRLNRKLRDEVEAELSESFRDFMLASAVSSPERLEQAVSFSKMRLMAEVKDTNLMSVHVPEIRFVREVKRENMTRNEVENGVETQAPGGQAYGYLQTSADLDEAVERLDKTMDRLLELAQVEKTCQLLADDIESTRRRVNALEYRTIPDLEETIKFIRMKLDENDRATITRLMKVKEMITVER